MSKRRQVTQLILGDFISPELFMARGTGDAPVESNLTYRIEEHQRFPSWSLHKKQLLVDSVLKDFPINAFILTRHNKNGDEYYSVEEGQTRMTALQEYLMDGFACEVGSIGNGKKYSELSQRLQTAFITYQVTVEIFKCTADSAREMAEIFNRLNSGKPLGDNDKFHSRLRISPVMHYMNEVKNHVDLRGDFARFVGPIGTGKSRKLLGDMVGAILSIATRDGDQGGHACINTSYELNNKYLNTDLSPEQKDDVLNFFRSYFSTLRNAIDSTSFRPQKRYGKLSGALGLSACAWVTSGTIPSAISWYVNKILYDRRYEPASFNALSQGDIRNCQGSAVKNRLEMIEKQWRIDNNIDVADLVEAEIANAQNGGSSVSDSDDEDEDEDEEEQEETA
jgi:hypothetical protein